MSNVFEVIKNLMEEGKKTKVYVRLESLFVPSSDYTKSVRQEATLELKEIKYKVNSKYAVLKLGEYECPIDSMSIRGIYDVVNNRKKETVLIGDANMYLDFTACKTILNALEETTRKIVSISFNY